MKIIVSHDVDHIKPWEHTVDFIIPKYWARTFIEFGLGYIRLTEVLRRAWNFLSNKWNNIEQLSKFDKMQDIPSTFFVAVAKGGGISYSLRDSIEKIEYLKRMGLLVGIHGIEFDDFSKIKREYDLFGKIYGFRCYGIRMHNLKVSEMTLQFLDNTGYLFDSTIPALRNPYKIGKMWEFPVTLMDGWVFYKNSRFQNQTLSQAKETTKKILNMAINKNLKFFTLLFHDRYFSHCFNSWMEWYIWLIRFLKDNKFEFINYLEAIKELERNNERYLDNK